MEFNILEGIKYPSIEKNKKILLFFIIMLASSLQIYNLEYKSLWLDEVLSLTISELSLGTILTSPDPAHPPFYYMLLHFFLYLGKSEFILRLPSVIFGILSIPLAYNVGKTFFGAREGLLSAFLLSISPVFVYYSQEARMYTLFAFLSLLSLFFFYTAIRKNDNRLWAGYIISTVLDIYTHYFAFLVISVEVMFFIFFLKSYQSSLKKFVLSLLCICILFLPQIPGLYSGTMIKQAKNHFGELNQGYPLFRMSLTH